MYKARWAFLLVVEDPDNRVTLSFLVSGQVAAAYVEEGEHVAVGQLLAEVEPISGVISAKQIDKGAGVGPGVTAFNIIKTDPVYAEASVSEEDISKVGVGDKVEVRIRVGRCRPEADFGDEGLYGPQPAFVFNKPSFVFICHWPLIELCTNKTIKL